MMIYTCLDCSLDLSSSGIVSTGLDSSLDLSTAEKLIVMGTYPTITQRWTRPT